jgi:peroxiredoxin
MGCVGQNHFLGAWLGGILSVSLIATQAAPPNDNLINATVLVGTTNFVIASNVDATSESGEPYHAGSQGGSSVWWSWQSPFTGSVSVSTKGSDFDTLLAVYMGNAFSNLQMVAANDDTGEFGVTSSLLVFRAYAGESFRIAVDGFNGATGTVQLAISRAGYPAPSWQLFDLKTNLVTSSDFRNRVLVVDFWETTCGACVDEIHDLVQLYHEYSPQGLAFFGVSKDPESSRRSVQYFAETYQIPYDIALNTPAMESSFGGEVPLPTKFVIDRENMIVGTYSGGGDYAYYQNILKPLLRGSTQVPLNARRQGGNLLLTWPATEFGYNLEITTSLGETNWMTNSFSIVMTNDENTMTIPITSANHFYRLRKMIGAQ